jgi:hypothetical protein
MLLSDDAGNLFGDTTLADPRFQRAVRMPAALLNDLSTADEVSVLGHLESFSQMIVHRVDVVNESPLVGIRIQNPLLLDSVDRFEVELRIRTVQGSQPRTLR